MENKEMKVGQVLPFGFKKIRCVLADKKDLCKGCCSKDVKTCFLLEKVVGVCDASVREDDKNIIFQIVREQV